MSVLSDLFQDIADAIGEKTGDPDKPLAPANFPDEIRSIVTAAGSDGSNLLYASGSLNSLSAPTTETRVIEHGLGVMPDFILIYGFVGLVGGYDEPIFCFAHGFNSKFTAITSAKSSWGFCTNRVPNPDLPPFGFGIVSIDRGMDELTEADRTDGYIYTPDSKTFEIGCYPGSQFYGTYMWQAFAWLSD